MTKQELKAWAEREKEIWELQEEALQRKRLDLLTFEQQLETEASWARLV